MEVLCESILAPIVQLTKELVLKHLCYITNAGNNVRKVTNEIEELRCERDDISNRIEREERDGRKPTKATERWMTKVEECEAKVNRIKQKYDQRGCILFGGCSLNCWSNYWTGKEASKKLKKAKELLEKRPLDIVTDKQLPSVQLMLPRSRVVGLESDRKTALSFLKDDKDTILGIWGKGGAGKTTLLYEINNSLFPNELDFNHVMLVVASQGCSTERIQSEIIQKLRLPKESDQNICSQASIITNYLIRKNFVLLLDDVWEKLDLAEIGIPYIQQASNNRKHKVIVVTRNEAVCTQMGAQKRIHVEGLKGDDAWDLFKEKVGEAILASHQRIKMCAGKIVEECGGLPLALVTIGCAMSNKKTLDGWREALSLLQKSRHITGTEQQLFFHLKLSYDYLKDDVMRECFLCCSLWPEDYDIPKKDLIECWMGHGLLGNFDSIRDAYTRGHAIIQSLLEASLLEHGCSRDFDMEASHVKLHDVIRDMALWIARDCCTNQNKWIVSAGFGLEEAPQEEKWIEAHKISLMHNNIGGLPATINTPCDSLTTLMIQYNLNLSGVTSFQYFHKLKYLDMSNCCLSFRSLPLEICRMVDLEYLNLSNILIGYLPDDFKKLKNLKYLQLRNGKVSMIPEGLMSNLVKLLVLDVHNTDVVNQESILNQLGSMEAIHLKALGINISTLLDIEKLIRIPILHLSLQRMEGETCLSLLSSKLLGSRNIHSTLRHLSIIDSTSLEKLSFDGNHQPLEFLEMLVLKNLPKLAEIIWKGVADKDLLPRVCIIDIHNCERLKEITWVVHLPCLEKLTISECSSMDKVIEEEAPVIREEVRPIVVRCLKIVSLWDLPSLACICSTAFTFPSLEVLSVRDCPQLKKLPFLSNNRPQNLESILGLERWWEDLNWEEQPSIKDSLLPLFQSIFD